MDTASNFRKPYTYRARVSSFEFVMSTICTEQMLSFSGKIYKCPSQLVVGKVSHESM